MAILGNLPGALVLASLITTWRAAGRFGPEHVSASFFLWPAMGLAALLAVAALLFLVRFAWLPLAAFDLGLGILFVTLVLVEILEATRGQWDVRSLSDRWGVVGPFLLGAAYVVAGVGVLADRGASHQRARAVTT